MLDDKQNILLKAPECEKCGKALRYLGDINLLAQMEKGLSAASTLADRKNVKMYVCDTCRKVSFYLP
jgi:hypothetical protein